MTAVLFYLFAILAVLAALLVVSLRNPMHCALSLFGFFFFVAGLFVLMNAEFVAVIQVFVYAGAILVLYIFVVMFMRLEKAELAKRRFHGQRFIAVVLALLMLAGFIIKVLPGLRDGPSRGMTPDKVAAAGGNVEVLGGLLLTEYLVPFELASLVLLVGMLGAVVLGRGILGRRKEPEA
ncbi:NADH-quinone oxidoreductase subunit J [bacterium]|nr:NADH-quinone oxidoreductase subunit J [candidate division CSSED10-310 bacterium]